MQYFSNYPDVISYLYGSLPMFQRMGGTAFNKDLGRTRELLAAMGNPENKFRSVHIAGTNGKGSSSHMISAIIQSNGYKTGLYTSPHLKEFTERIRINGREVPREFVIDFVNNWRQLLEEIKPSFFETTVAMAYELFAKEEVDLAIVEVGMGGRLDSTNVITPLVSLITHISYDHQQYLGDTLPEIAAEKAGIIKPGIPVIIGNRQDEVMHVFEEVARANNSELIVADDHWNIQPGQDQGYEISHEGSIVLSHLIPDLKGDYIRSNLPGVLAVSVYLKLYFNEISIKKIGNALQSVSSLTGLKGRWQLLNESPRVICDVGHNEDGVRNIVQQLERECNGKLFMIWGSVNDKDLEPILKLLPNTAEYFYTQPDIPRALPAEELAILAGEHGLTGQLVKDVNEALAMALELAGPDDLIFVGGSTFVVAGLNSL